MRRILLMVLAGTAVAVLLAAGSGSATPRKQPQSQLAYRLAVKFAANYQMEAHAADETGDDDRDTTFAGRSGPFLLVRSGTAAKPSYKLGEFLSFSGPLGFTGTAHYELGIGSSRACSYDSTMTIKGDQSAEVHVGLFRNQLRLSIISDATVVQRDSGGCGSPHTWTFPDGRGLKLSPGNPSEADWSRKLNAFHLRQVRFGKPFILVLSRDHVSDPTMQRTFNKGLGNEFWSHTWTLTFTPVKAR